MARPTCVIAIDAGTTGIRSRAVYADGRPTVASYREFTQFFPQPGWVEHDADEIWEAVRATLTEVVDQVGIDQVAAIGLTNQRETVVAWSRSTGRPLAKAIVWQDRRTAARCDELVAAGHLELVRSRTGLVLDPYFSGTKFEWLLNEGGVEVTDDLALGTIDSWVIWNLTGGERLRHRRHQRQPHAVVRHPDLGVGSRSLRPAGRPDRRAWPRSFRRADGWG